MTEFIVAFLLVLGLVLILGIRLKDIAPNMNTAPPTMKKIVATANGSQGNFIEKRFFQMKEMLAISGRLNQYSRFCAVSMVLACLCAVGSLLINNIFLVPVSALIGLFLPFLYVSVTSVGYKKQCNREAETAMSVVTSSYLRTNNLLQSVSENIEYIHEPIKSVFKSFLAENEFITVNIEKSIKHMEKRVDNQMFLEWCEALILCQHDRNKKYMLDPIITKLRSMESVQIELDSMLFKPLKDFVIMVVLVLVNFPLLYFINRSWFNILFTTTVGKIAVAVTFAGLLFALCCVMKAVKPIEYKK